MPEADAPRPAWAASAARDETGSPLAATVVWAFLKTCWELGTVHYKKLCTFVGALRRFCRDYWSKTAAV